MSIDSFEIRHLSAWLTTNEITRILEPAIVANLEIELIKIYNETKDKNLNWAQMLAILATRRVT